MTRSKDDDEPNSSEAETSEDDGFDDSNYESECPLDYPPRPGDDYVACFKASQGGTTSYSSLVTSSHMPSEYEPLKNDNDGSEGELLYSSKRNDQTIDIAR